LKGTKYLSPKTNLYCYSAFLYNVGRGTYHEPICCSLLLLHQTYATHAMPHATCPQGVTPARAFWATCIHATQIPSMNPSTVVVYFLHQTNATHATCHMPHAIRVSVQPGHFGPPASMPLSPGRFHHSIIKSIFHVKRMRTRTIPGNAPA